LLVALAPVDALAQVVALTLVDALGLVDAFVALALACTLINLYINLYIYRVYY
jgi:hypothetical protein